MRECAVAQSLSTDTFSWSRPGEPIVMGASRKARPKLGPIVSHACCLSCRVGKYGACGPDVAFGISPSYPCFLLMAASLAPQSLTWGIAPWTPSSASPQMSPRASRDEGLPSWCLCLCQHFSRPLSMGLGRHWGAGPGAAGQSEAWGSVIPTSSRLTLQGSGPNFQQSSRISPRVPSCGSLKGRPHSPNTRRPTPPVITENKSRQSLVSRGVISGSFPGQVLPSPGPGHSFWASPCFCSTCGPGTPGFPSAAGFSLHFMREGGNVGG